MKLTAVILEYPTALMEKQTVNEKFSKGLIQNLLQRFFS